MQISVKMYSFVKKKKKKPIEPWRVFYNIMMSMGIGCSGFTTTSHLHHTNFYYISAKGSGPGRVYHLLANQIFSFHILITDNLKLSKS